MWLPPIAPLLVRIPQDTGRDLPEQVSDSFPREGLRSWRIPLRGPRDEYLPIGLAMADWQGNRNARIRLLDSLSAAFWSRSPLFAQSMSCC